MNRGYLRDTRKGLRNNSTPAEIALWQLLKHRQLDGRKFRRQTSIENYVVDFCCVEERIVIELDGGIHSHPAIAENDKQRDGRLADLGYKVLRFDNQDVFNLPDWVQGEIRKAFGE